MADPVVAHLLDDIPFQPDIPTLLRRLHIKPGSQREQDLTSLVNEAAQIARPRALILMAYINARGEDWVEVAGQRFDSRVLRINLAEAHRVFPFVATCGVELQDWADGVQDMLLNYWAEAIKESALLNAVHAMDAFLEQRYQPGKTATMNPGSLEDWPIQQQRALFNLLGVFQEQVGVQLTDSLLMIPTKSISGIRFPTEIDFESCELCPREDCPGRRAPYDPTLAESRYNLGHG